LEVIPIENMEFYIDPDLLSKARLAGHLNYTIKEKAQKNTVLTGSFNLAIPETPF